MVQDSLLVLPRDSLFAAIDPSWSHIIEPLRNEIELVFQRISTDEFIPSVDRIFAPLRTPFDKVKIVIVGQDPYPNPNYANGLAFSVRPEVTSLPASLNNIFKELENDCQVPIARTGNLERWAEQGVLLINRTLTTISGQSHAHRRAGWLPITEAIIAAVASNGAVGILWGADAEQLADYFNKDHVIKSAHPSPLSAYRGFFSSKPFSRANKVLVAQGLTPIKW
ncbi:MAG: uracil-DNA glycosylase [Candidatus Planktophila sp.]